MVTTSYSSLIALEDSPHLSITSESYPDMICLACGGGTNLLLRRPPVVYIGAFLRTSLGHQHPLSEVRCDNSCLSEQICGMAEWWIGGTAEWEWRNSGIEEGRNGGNS